MPISASVRSRGARTGTAVAAAVAVAGLSLAGASAAFAQGESGELDVRPVGRSSNGSPHVNADGIEVCGFKLVASNFGELPAVPWTIATQPPIIPPGTTLTGTLPLSQGSGETQEYQLPEGTYVLTWTAPAPKTKTFKVDCSKKEGNSGSKNEWKPEDKEKEKEKAEGSSWSDSGESGSGESGGKEYSKPSGAVPAGGGGVPTMESVGSESDSNVATTTALAVGAAGLAGLVLVRRQARRRARGEA